MANARTAERDPYIRTTREWIVTEVRSDGTDDGRYETVDWYGDEQGAAGYIRRRSIGVDTTD